MRIAITGATGFLGKYLVDFLSERDYDVLVIARPEESAANIFKHISIFESDYSGESLMAAFTNCDFVIHLAAQTMMRSTDPLRVSQFYDVNVAITENVLVAAQMRGIKQVVQMSSNSVYSNANKLPFNEADNPIPGTIYGVSKLYAEKLGEYISYHRGINVISLRLARLFGYGERDTVVFTKYMKLALSKQPVEVWGEGNVSIDYLYVKDVIVAIETVLKTNISSGIYNLGSGRTYSVSEIASSICSICKNEPNLVYDKSKVESGYNILLDSTKFYEATNWKPSWNLSDAIADMYHLYLENS